MRKFLSFFIILLSVLVSCDNTTTEMEVSSETRVNTFSFQKDTANLGLTEATYKIEHIADSGIIYCTDSLRFGTSLDSVVPYITYKATPASAEFILPDTTIISTGADTINFSKGPIYLLVTATDSIHTRKYRIKIDVHQADPNLYVWKRMTDKIFSPQLCDLKAFMVDDTISLFVNNGFSTRIYQSLDGTTWQQTPTPIGLPIPCQVRDILQHGDTMYYMDDNKLYTSMNLITWQETDFSARSYDLINMLVVFDNKSWCILQDRSSKKLFLGTIANGDVLPSKDIYGLDGNILPENFPVSDFAAIPVANVHEQ